MATTAIWSVKGDLSRVVNYAANPDKTAFRAEDIQGLRDVMAYAAQDDKTEEQRYVSGINCNPEIAREQMLMVKRQFGKEGGIAAFHGYQSFAPGEVTPEQAHEIGKELARQLWGDRFQVVVATHLDRAHIHNHFVLNSVSFVDGKKYNDCKASYALMRQTSDKLCRERGLSVIAEPQQGRTMSYDAWEAEQKGRPTWYGQIRRDVDAAITRSFLFEHFIANLKKQGYEVKTGKYIAVRPPGKERFVRLKITIRRRPYASTSATTSRRRSITGQLLHRNGDTSSKESQRSWQASGRFVITISTCFASTKSPQLRPDTAAT
ncbi:MAG: relaxase/mobilization nuclease domain-containing protein [Oscillospiraceae bacterium]|nr:relaxase/mobilization nuclease domain-containing protein [Oscillospiraceae bacterium]